VDLSGVTGVDSTGARVLTGLGHYVRARGGHFTVIGGAPSVLATLAAEETATG
jgi:anti-anti-sigma regulatory factor